MSEQIPPAAPVAPVVFVQASQVQEGCTGCGTQQTVTLDSRFGRRCAEHSPWVTHAAEGRFTEAWASLRAWLGTRGAA